MGYRAIQRVYSGPKREPAIGHHELLSDRWSGILHVLWEIDSQRPVFIGAGWYILEEPKAPRQPDYSLGPRRRPSRQQIRAQAATQPEVVAEMVRRGPQGLPILPGSSLKGAIRQVYELLTPSCEPGRGKDSCSVRPNQDIAHTLACPACSLFGAPGLGGRVSFGEAAPVEGACKAVLRKVPTAWPPRRWERGSFRVYDLAKAVQQGGQAAPEIEPTWMVHGTFHSEIRLVNASDDELGLLFAAMGFGAAKPRMRLGGKKFHGLGCVNPSLERAVQRKPGPEVLELENPGQWALDLATKALDAEKHRREVWQSYHEVISSS